MLPVVGGLLLMLVGTCATSWGISHSSEQLNLRYLILPLVAFVVGVDLAVSPFVTDMHPAVSIAILLAGQIGLTYGMLRILIRFKSRGE